MVKKCFCLWLVFSLHGVYPLQIMVHGFSCILHFTVPDFFLQGAIELCSGGFHDFTTKSFYQVKSLKILAVYLFARFSFFKLKQIYAGLSMLGLEAGYWTSLNLQQRINLVSPGNIWGFFPALEIWWRENRSFTMMVVCSSMVNSYVITHCFYNIFKSIEAAVWRW